jgi:hypothetical protein
MQNFCIYSFGINLLLILSPQNTFSFKSDIDLLIAFFRGLFSDKELNAFSVFESAKITPFAGLNNLIMI